MAKILTDKNLLDIISRTINGDEIDDADQYMEFIKDIGGVICDHFGGDVVGMSSYKDYNVLIAVNDCVPENGGVFADYDKSVQWIDGREFNPDNPMIERD